MLLDSCLQVTSLSQFVIVNPRNTVLEIFSLKGTTLEYAFTMHRSSTNSSSPRDLP